MGDIGDEFLAYPLEAAELSAIVAREGEAVRPSVVDKVVVGDAVNADAVWYYPEPKDAAAEIKDHFAFWKGVTVEP